jgi:hypothetical protein
MTRRITNTCNICGARYSQDWEDQDECPYCDENEADDGGDDDELEDSTLAKYANYLSKVMNTENVATRYRRLKATCAQKTEATLKACGKWEDK